MKTVRKALAVLKQLAEADGPMGVTEISVATGVDKAIVYRALRTLVDETFVAQDPASRKYQLGPGLLHMAGLQLRQLPFVEIAKPHLLRLWAETNETIHLCVRHDLEVMLTQVYESRQGVRVSSRLGERAPLHCTAGGKIFLAFGPSDLIDRAGKAGLAPRQPNTITDLAKLRADIGTVRKRGYSIDLEESDQDYSAVAARVASHDEHCLAAVAIALPIRRYRAKSVDELVRPLIECADAISADLGAH